MNLKRLTSGMLVLCMAAASLGNTGAPLAGRFTVNSTASSRSDALTVCSVVGLDGEKSNNANKNTYRTWSAPVTSYLTENADGELCRFEYLPSKDAVAAEKFSTSLTRRSEWLSKLELPIFGGFFSGSDHNYIVYGNKNSSESKTNEVMRVVKYTKNWERVSACNITGANTLSPFEAGSLRMIEHNGLLYIYTCHTMFKSSDGLNHQSNMTFVINESTMKVTQSYYDVMNIKYGYVSHSFNQFIRTDGTSLYRVDHGDAYPRAVSITKCDISGKITDVKSSVEVFRIGGNTGNNTTNVTVGGFELSSSNCLIAGTTGDQSKFGTDEGRVQNVFLAVTDKTLKSPRLIMLTNYTQSSKVTVGTPQLVKLGDNSFLIMWNEVNSSTNRSEVKAVTVDGNGSKTSLIYSTALQLSDCQPIVGKDGLVKWYVTTGGSPVLYRIDPKNLGGIKYFPAGDVDNDGKIAANDASLVLGEYANASAGHPTFTSEQKSCADITRDGKITAGDASAILAFYSYLMNGGKERDIFKLNMS